MAIKMKVRTGSKDAVTATRERRTSARTRRPDMTGVSVSLPESRSSPLADLKDYAVMAYGPPGSGKTTLANVFGRCFQLMFEPGAKGLEAYQRLVQQWPEAVAYVDLLEKKPTSYDNVAVDVIEAAWDMYFDWFIVNRLDGKHPNELKDRGASWKELRREFEVSFFHRLLALPIGTLWISHERRIPDPDNLDVIVEIRPNLSGQPWSITEGMMDVILWYDMHAGERMLCIDGFDLEPRVATKNRLKHNFRTVNGDRIKWIPAGHSEEETYANLLRAFNNQQRAPDGREPRKLKVRLAK